MAEVQQQQSDSLQIKSRCLVLLRKANPWQTQNAQNQPQWISDRDTRLQREFVFVCSLWQFLFSYFQFSRGWRQVAAIATHQCKNQRSNKCFSLKATKDLQRERHQKENRMLLLWNTGPRGSLPHRSKSPQCRSWTILPTIQKGHQRLNKPDLLVSVKASRVMNLTWSYVLSGQEKGFRTGGGSGLGGSSPQG